MPRWQRTMSSEVAPPHERRIADRYRLLEQIDRGGAGVVWRARDERLDRDVAVKLLGAEADVAFRERFEHEARRAASVSHPNVVAVFDGGRDGTDAFMVMEYVRGRTLRDLITERGPLPPDEASRLVSQVAAALDAAHQASVLHLDVKPANVIVADSGIAKLTDFGVAVAAHDEAERELVGTARYVAPERIEGEAPTERSDVYGLGLVAYELLAGRPAYQGVDTEDLLRMRLEGPPPSVRAARLGLTAELDAVVARALARDPAARYPTPGDFARAFKDAAGRADQTTVFSGVTAVRPLPRKGHGGVPRLDNTLALLAVIVVLLAVVAFFLSAGSASSLPLRATAAPAATAAGPAAPNVVGMRLDKANQTLLAAGFRLVEYDVAAGAGGSPCSIARQDPAAGTAIQRGSTAKVFYVPGKDCLRKNDD